MVAIDLDPSRGWHRFLWFSPLLANNLVPKIKKECREYFENPSRMEENRRGGALGSYSLGNMNSIHKWRQFSQINRKMIKNGVVLVESRKIPAEVRLVNSCGNCYRSRRPSDSALFTVRPQKAAAGY